MMTGETIHDALNLLPDDLLEAADALRQKKRIRWIPLAAVAACICLCFGLWQLFPGGSKSAENGTGIADGFAEEHSGHSSPMMLTVDLTVISVTQSHITAESLDPASADGALAEPVTISLENIADAPTLSPGQIIRVTCAEAVLGGAQIHPYKIEIIKEVP